MFVIITIIIIIVPRDFNTSYNTLRIVILNTFKNNTLKTKILNSATLVTHKLRDALFIRNKAISLLNT